MNLRVFTTLRQRVALLLVSVLVPAVGLVLANVLSARTQDRREVQDEAYRLATVASATYERLVESIELMFAAAGQLPAAGARDASACRAALAPILVAARRFQNIGVIARGGSLQCSAADTGSAGPHGPWLQQALDSPDLVMGSFERGSLSPEPTVVFARRLAPDRPELVLFAALDLESLARMTEAVPLPTGSSLNVIDDQGIVVARYPDHPEWVGRDVRTAPLVATARGQREGSMETAGIDEVERVYGFRRVMMPGGREMIVSVGIPLDVAYGAANARLRTSLIVLGAVAGMSLLIARIVSERLFTRRVDSLLRAARRLSAGDLTARTDQRWSDDELGELARTFDSMAWAVGQRTEDLRHMMEALRALAARLEAVREEERTRISREIHDELGQTLTGIRMDLDRLEERIAAAHAMTDGERAGIDAKIQSVRRLAESGLDTARRISRQLRPSVLDVLGLRAGIEWQLEEFQARTGITAELLAPDDLGNVGDERSIALFRILQEALTNVMRHARATTVTVRVEREADAIVMEVMDNGQGFEQSARGYPASLGLLGMRERAATLGGLTTVTSAPGRGTTVHVQLPLRDPVVEAGERA